MRLEISAGIIAVLFLLTPNTLPAQTTSIAILVYDGVYNTEFVAPLDVFDHVNAYVDGAVDVFLVAPEKATVTSVEGLRFEADYGFSDHPPVDVLIVPSFENYEDLGARADVIEWVRRTAADSDFVLSNCWGAFFLARAGLLDGRHAMTYPPDIDKLGREFPQVRVVKGVSFVRDGKFVTGGGGVASYDNALYVVQELWGPEVASRIASGLVKPWKLADVPHRVITR